MLSTLALNMQTVAVGWQLYLLTGSAFDLGLVGLAQFAPTVVLTLVVGQVADRYDRRVVVVLCHVAEAGATAVLALGSLGGVAKPALPALKDRMLDEDEEVRELVEQVILVIQSSP